SAELYDLLDKQISPQIANVAGVGQVSLVGSNERQIQVNVDKDKLAAFKLTVSQVATIVNASSISSPAGQVETPENTYSIQYNAKFSDLDQLRNLVIAQYSNGSKVLLRDVAEVVDAQVKVTSLNHFNGVPAIGMQILKQTD